MSLDPLTELEAVNIILRNDGEAPVAQLDEDGFDEAADAQAALNEISRAVQGGGWSFNVDVARKFTPTGTKEIQLPSSTLWIRPAYTSRNRQVVERGRKLYDLEKNSYEFDQPVYLDLCQMLAFNELPSTARYYITVRAARVYQARATGSGSQNQFTEGDEMRAQADLKKADSRVKPRGFFRNPYNAASLDRTPGSGGLGWR